MKIIGIKTNDGYFVTDNLSNDGYFNSKLPNLIVNGFKPLNSFHKDWFKVKEQPIKIQRLVSMPNINHRFELKDKSLLDKFKDVYLESDVLAGRDEEGDRVYSDIFQSIVSLYEYKSDKQDPILEDIEFIYETIQEVDLIDSPKPFSYKVYGKWSSDVSKVANGIEKYDMIDRIITPSVLIHTKPCILTKKESYAIVRAYIKDNINPKVAEITSDYDFCLTVKKKIPLIKPHVYQVDVNNSIFNSRKKKPKYETRTQTNTSIEVYKTSPEGYNGYPIIESFKAEDSDSLKEYIDSFLDHLIGVINEPLSQCECCKGTGVITS